MSYEDLKASRRKQLADKDPNEENLARDEKVRERLSSLIGTALGGAKIRVLTENTAMLEYPNHDEIMVTICKEIKGRMVSERLFFVVKFEQFANFADALIHAEKKLSFWQRLFRRGL